MGFDLYGKNPTNPEGHQPPSFDWSRTDIDDSEKKAYFEALEEYQKKVKGDYFRANVWYWRPLWDYVCHVCDDILTEKDWESGHYNDGHTISEEKAVQIGKRLNEQIESGRAEAYVKAHEQERNEAEEGNKGLKVGDEGYNWAESYPLDLENIQRFAVFCSESGGFTIC